MEDDTYWKPRETIQEKKMCECCGGDCKLTEKPFTEQLSEQCDVLSKDLDEAVEKGWYNVQSTRRPDVSFRVMLDIISKWKKYIDNLSQSKKLAILDVKSKIDEDLLTNKVISRLEDIGRAKQMIKSILDDDIFDTLSKHNPYWDSEHEVESEKLYDCRMKFGLIQDNLWGLYSILDKEEE